MQGGGARGQNLEHLRIFFFLLLFFSCMELFVFEQQVLFRGDSLCDFQPYIGFRTLGWGKGSKSRTFWIFFFPFSFHSSLYLNKWYYLGFTFSL